MTYQHADFVGLPDPELDSQFYENVPTRRLVAWVFDSMITFALTMIASIFMLGLGFFIFGLVWLVVGFIYRTVTIGSSSATWGMSMVGIEFRDRQGNKFSSGLSLIHTAIFTAASGTFIVQLISAVLILMTRYGQSLPDMILGSTAINRPVN